jgi:hypothetical protein
LTDGSPRWIEAVKGCDEAKKRIAQLMSASSAQYQVHDPRTNTFIDAFAKKNACGRRCALAQGARNPRDRETPQRTPPTSRHNANL